MTITKWTGPESNWRHTAFQAVALPTELPVQKFHDLTNEVKLSHLKFLGSRFFLPESELLNFLKC